MEYGLVCPVKAGFSVSRWQCSCRIHYQTCSPAVADISSFYSKASINDTVNFFKKEKHEGRNSTSL